MKGDITIYITPCNTEDHKKYNKTILEVMENSKVDYTLTIPQNRLQGLIRIEVNLFNDDQKNMKLWQEI